VLNYIALGFRARESVGCRGWSLKLGLCGDISINALFFPSFAFPIREHISQSEITEATNQSFKISVRILHIWPLLPKLPEKQQQ
jgi:hypothetical protein